MSLYLGENKIADNTCSRNIGEIVASTIPLSDAGLHLLDGAVINGAGSYAKFVTYIAGLVTDYPDLFTAEADWQSSVSTYGVCGKFVYDSVNNTVRLPKITGFTEGTTDVTALGDLIEAGLPNITGTACNTTRNATAPYLPTKTGALYNVSGLGEVGHYVAPSYNNTDAAFTIGLDASLSSSIYGNSTTVQPQAIKVLYYIVIANSTVTVSIENLDVLEVGKAFVDLFYPVGSIYIGNTSTCPLAAVKGTWELVSSGRVLQGADSGHSAGTTIEAGLPNITGWRTGTYIGPNTTINYGGAIYTTGQSVGSLAGQGGNSFGSFGFDASRSSSIYGKSTTVQPPAYCVNIWKRTA